MQLASFRTIMLLGKAVEGVQWVRQIQENENCTPSSSSLFVDCSFEDTHTEKNYTNETTSDGRSIDESAACYSNCQSLASAASLCFYRSGCSVDDCAEYPAIEYCCSSCSDIMVAAALCLNECLPTSVEHAIQDYAVCFTANQCEFPCAAKLKDLSSEGTVNSTRKDYSIEISNATGSVYVDLFLDDTAVNLEDATCEDVQADYADSVCTVVDCCPQCNGELELLLNAVVDGMVFLYLNRTEDCEFACQQERRILISKQSAAGSMSHQYEHASDRAIRLLAVATKRDSPTNLLDNSLRNWKIIKLTDGNCNLKHVVRRLLTFEEEIEVCYNRFYQLITVARDKSFESFMECFLSRMGTLAMRADQLDQDGEVGDDGGKDVDEDDKSKLYVDEVRSGNESNNSTTKSAGVKLYSLLCLIAVYGSIIAIWGM